MEYVCTTPNSAATASMVSAWATLHSASSLLSDGRVRRTWA